MRRRRLQPSLDIIIPVYNEAGNILPVLQSLRDAVRTPFRVLICYDSERDTTLRALAVLPRGAMRIVRVRNSGRGPHGAVLAGFRASRAPAVMVFPVDDVYNAGIVDSMVRACRAGYDIVVPSRFMPGGRMEGCPWLKAALVRSASFTLRHLARLPARDATNGFRLFSRRALTTIQIESSRGFSFSLELLVKAHRLGWRIKEVPAIWIERTRGRSRFQTLGWIPAYLRWYAFAFATTWLRRGPETVLRRG